MSDLSEIPAAEPPTRELIQAAVQGQPAAWAELDARLRARMRTLLAGRIPLHMRSRFDVEDVLQQGFLEAARKLGDFEDRGAESFERWISQIMFNELRDKIRFHAAERRSFEREEEVASEILMLANLDLDTPSTILSKEEQEQDMSAALRQLPLEEQELIRLRFRERQSWSEIAERVGSSETTVRRRCLEALERQLKTLQARSSGR